MNSRQRQNIIFTLIITSLFLTATLISNSALAASLKERMKARLPQITELKAKGIIGENNRGYLELRSQNAAATTLITAENQDRQTVYNAIAQQQHTSPTIVGQRRAAQITARAAAGTWLQNTQGTWYKK
jgi:uncharacterized protein YdbL (DUF1318 family)